MYLNIFTNNNIFIVSKSSLNCKQLNDFTEFYNSDSLRASASLYSASFMEAVDLPLPSLSLRSISTFSGIINSTNLISLLHLQNLHKLWMFAAFMIALSFLCVHVHWKILVRIKEYV